MIIVQTQGYAISFHEQTYIYHSANTLTFLLHALTLK